MTTATSIPTSSALPVPPAYDARALIHAGTEAKIVLDDKIYTLRITKAGKLILNK